MNSLMKIVSQNLGLYKHLYGNFIHETQKFVNTFNYSTSYMVKRRYPISINKKGTTFPKKLRRRDFVYEIVAKPSLKDLPNINLILTKYAPGFGERGTFLTIDQITGYQKLLLPGFAVYASPDEIQKFSKEGKSAQTHSSSLVMETIDKIQKRSPFSIVMNKEMPWTIERWHIRASFRRAGVHILSDDCIILPETPIKGPDLTLEGKSFFITIKINNAEETKVRCTLHHWSTYESERLPYEDKYWLKPVELLLSEGKGSEAEH